MSAQHTPGPWVARPDPHGSKDDACVGLDDECTPVDYVAVCRRHDARLIAAAPDGLDAAQEALIALEAAPDSVTVQIARQKLRAFIAKATGGAA